MFCRLAIMKVCPFWPIHMRRRNLNAAKIEIFLYLMAITIHHAWCACKTCFVLYILYSSRVPLFLNFPAQQIYRKIKFSHKGKQNQCRITVVTSKSMITTFRDLSYTQWEKSTKKEKGTDMSNKNSPKDDQVHFRL